MLIIMDDQNDQTGILNNPGILTPNLDRLSKKGTIFTHAYCSAPSCGPSRASLLSGLFPSTTGVYYNSQPGNGEQSALSGAVTLPRLFKDQGYITGLFGKVFHEENRPKIYEAMCTPGFFSPHTGFWANAPDTSVVHFTDFRYEGGSNFVWGAVPDEWENDEHKLIDTENSDKVIACLEKKLDHPFFMALGLLRPHLPWIVPKRFYELYPLDSIKIPGGYLPNDLDDLPECAKWMALEVPGDNLGVSNLQTVITGAHKWKEAIQAYQASTAYSDFQLGRVLDALDKSAYATNTIVILCGDNGYHVGEKDHWTKFGLWEKSNKVPLIISVPGSKQCVYTSPVSLVDLYPTIISLTGIKPPRQKLEGLDLSHLLKNSDGIRGMPVLSTYGFGCHSLRNEKYRYIRYRNGDEELYDHLQDPYEWNNLATDSSYNYVKREMIKYLPVINEPETDHGSNLGWDVSVFERGYVYDNKKQLRVK